MPKMATSYHQAGQMNDTRIRRLRSYLDHDGSIRYIMLHPKHHHLSPWESMGVVMAAKKSRIVIIVFCLVVFLPPL